MDIQFTSLNNAAYMPTIVNHTSSGEHFNAENAISKTNEVPPKVMMDLRDVQNFLYMIIGSEIQLKSTNNTIGAGFNTAV